MEFAVAKTKVAEEVTTVAESSCPGCDGKLGACADCTDRLTGAELKSEPQTEPQAEPAHTPTPAAGGRYARAADGTLTPLED